MTNNYKSETKVHRVNKNTVEYITKITLNGRLIQTKTVRVKMS